MALSKSMKHLRDTQSIDLPGNALGGKASAAILESMQEKVRYLNMANNAMGPSACNKLVEWIDNNSVNCILEQINLEGNKLSDFIIEEIVQALLKT